VPGMCERSPRFRRLRDRPTLRRKNPDRAARSRRLHLLRSRNAGMRDPARSDLSPPHAWVKDWLDHTGPGCVKSNWPRRDGLMWRRAAELDAGCFELLSAGLADGFAQLFVGASPARSPLVVEGEQLSERQAGDGLREVRLGELDDFVDDPSPAGPSPGLESGDRGEGDHSGGTFVLLGRICGRTDAAFGEGCR